MKKKILAFMLCVIMLVIAVAGGTMAYFTDEHTQTNTFTAGKVGISLDEVKPVKDEDPESRTYGDLIASDKRTADPQSYHLFPGMIVAKDPTIVVDQGSEDAYVAAIVTVTGDVRSLIPMDGSDTLININAVAKGGEVEKASSLSSLGSLTPVFETDTCYIYQQAAGNNTWKIYVFVKAAQEAGDDIVLFEKLEIDPDWNNNDMEKLNNMQINVTAYAVQANGFATCYDAMVAAFGQNATDPFKF